MSTTIEIMRSGDNDWTTSQAGSLVEALTAALGGPICVTDPGWEWDAIARERLGSAHRIGRTLAARRERS